MNFLKGRFVNFLCGALVAFIGIGVGAKLTVGAGENNLVERDNLTKKLVSYEQNVNAFNGGKKVLELDKLSEDKLQTLENKNYTIVITRTIDSRDGYKSEATIDGNTIKVTVDAPEGVLVDLVNKVVSGKA